MPVKVMISARNEVRVERGDSYSIDAKQMLHINQGDKRIVTFCNWDGVVIEAPPGDLSETYRDISEALQRVAESFDDVSERPREELLKLLRRTADLYAATPPKP